MKTFKKELLDLSGIRAGYKKPIVEVCEYEEVPTGNKLHSTSVHCLTKLRYADHGITKLYLEHQSKGKEKQERLVEFGQADDPDIGPNKYYLNILTEIKKMIEEAKSRKKYPEKVDVVIDIFKNRFDDVTKIRVGMRTIKDGYYAVQLHYNYPNKELKDDIRDIFKIMSKWM